MGETSIIYTHTDEAPMLATASLLPIVRAFASQAGIDVQTRDISLSGRILAAMSPWLPEDQRVPDALAELGELTGDPNANLIKLPNISASMPQLKAAIAELQSQGVPVPDYPDSPADEDQQAIKAAYDKVKGSAVNPVLRQGNSDRRAPASVKNYARNNPHSMGSWNRDSKTNVATMSDGDFRHTEQSVTLPADDVLRIELTSSDGQQTVLKDGIKVLAGEIFDASVMRVEQLRSFLADAIGQAADQDVLFSVHLKATMMKVSDPIIFGHVVAAFFADVFDQYGSQLAEAGANPRDGLAAVLRVVDELPEPQRDQIKAAFDERLAAAPGLAMVDSDKGITNLHVPSDVIVDASMPAMIRIGGYMWDADGAKQETLAVLPDSSYAAVYQAVIDDCKAHGAFDPATMGSVPNVGLMAQAAEEYGSHDKTFEIPNNGVVRVLNSSDEVLLEHEVSAGDIWRGCQTKDIPVRDWVQLAVKRARVTGAPAVFWLDETRAHDAQLINKVRDYLAELDTDGLTIEIMAPAEATKYSIERIRRGEDTISVTGNVLRDYLTDLFPILELGTSAKMLSVVPLIAGGGLFETGAGGSAPKHVQQLLEENHLRWDSLGEFLALAVSFEQLAHATDNPKAQVLADTLDRATGKLLAENKSPERKAGQLDNRGSHYYLAKYWAEQLATQTDDSELAAAFWSLNARLGNEQARITQELIDAQGQPVDIGGYYRPDPELVAKVMRPSETFNQAIAMLH